MKEFEKGITERKRWLALAYKENLRNEEKMRRNEVNSHWSYLNKLGVWCFFYRYFGSYKTQKWYVAELIFHLVCIANIHFHFTNHFQLNENLFNSTMKQDRIRKRENVQNLPIRKSNKDFTFDIFFYYYGKCCYSTQNSHLYFALHVPLTINSYYRLFISVPYGHHAFSLPFSRSLYALSFAICFFRSFLRAIGSRLPFYGEDSLHILDTSPPISPKYNIITNHINISRLSCWIWG